MVVTADKHGFNSHITVWNTDIEAIVTVNKAGAGDDLHFILIYYVNHLLLCTYTN